MKTFVNTTPFIALSSVGQLNLLPKLFGSVFVAQSVVDECSHGGPVPVPSLDSLDWVVSVPDDANQVWPALFELDQGEKQTILLALRDSAELVIIDERIGRQMAEYLGLKVTGTLGVLAKAKSLGLVVSFRRLAIEMMQRGIYYNAGLIDRIALRLGEPIE